MRGQRRKNQRGFTLLELLMVVIIIGILAAIALPQYARTADRARAAEALTNLAALRSAEARFAAGSSTTAYTTALANLDIDMPGFGVVPVSPNWAFAVPTAGSPGSGVNAVATATAGGTISMDLDSGDTCADTAANATKWGVTGTSC